MCGVGFFYGNLHQGLYLLECDKMLYMWEWNRAKLEYFDFMFSKYDKWKTFPKEQKL